MEQFKLQASRAPAYHTQGRAPLSVNEEVVAPILEPGSLETGAAPTTSSAASNVAFQIYFRLSYHIAGTPLFDEKGKAEVGPADSIRNRVYKAFNDLNMLILPLAHPGMTTEQLRALFSAPPASAGGLPLRLPFPEVPSSNDEA